MWQNGQLSRNLRPTDLNLAGTLYKMTKKRPCKKYSLAKFRTLERFFR